MIIITGAAGFIGSCMVSKLNREAYFDLVLVDKFSRKDKELNYANKKYTSLVDRDNLGEWIDHNHKLIQFVFHLGARTDTAETNTEIFNKLNTEYSKMIWRKCCFYGLPLIYASSAATYGNGEVGYDDDHNHIDKLKPLNQYAISKNEFDKWALNQEVKPFFWTGIKFFNVYGPNEYHKGRMASVIFHAFKQISETGKLVLFKSHNPDYKDGEQKRDFIYVLDAVNVLYKMMLKRKHSGIYNLGTGKATSFLELAYACFKALEIEPVIEFVDTPEDIRDKYQYYTKADINKLKEFYYGLDFNTLTEGVEDYVRNFLVNKSYY